MSAGALLLEVRNVSVDYGSTRRRMGFRVVHDVTFSIDRGETLGLVGESGSGKSTIAKAILHLVPVASGYIRLNGVDVTQVTPSLRRALGAKVQAVFQDPYSSFNPSRTIRDSLCEMLRPHGTYDRAGATRRARELLDVVGMPATTLDKYPREFSGGQRQRIAIARALMVGPELLICDEAVSALDLSVQAQVVNLLRSIQVEFGLALLFISHDLGVVDFVSRRVMVLYRGRLMEMGAVEDVRASTAHPYTQLLKDAVLHPDPEQRTRRGQLEGTSDSGRAEAFCAFARRCRYVTTICERVAPPLVEVDADHMAACHHADAVLSRAARRRAPGEENA